MYIVSVTNVQHIFRDCGFEKNVAEDGGAFYLNTAMAVDIFIGSVFRNNYAGEFVTTCSVCMQNGPMSCSEKLMSGPDQRPNHMWHNSMATLQLSKGYVPYPSSRFQICLIQLGRVETPVNIDIYEHQPPMCTATEALNNRSSSNRFFRFRHTSTTCWSFDLKLK